MEIETEGIRIKFDDGTEISQLFLVSIINCVAHKCVDIEASKHAPKICERDKTTLEL